MILPARGLVRALRAGALAIVVLAVSAVAHVAGAGAVPGWGQLVALGLPVLACCVLLTRRRLDTIPLLAAMGTGQYLLHQAFMALSPSPMPSMAPERSMAPAILMLAAHAIATVVLAAAFSAGDGALWRLCAWLIPLGLLELVEPQVVVRRPLAVAGIDPPVLAQVRQHAVGRRGPPAAPAG